MAVLISADKKDLIVTCDCECDNTFHIKIDTDDDEYFSFLTYLNGNFFAEQKSFFDRFKDKLRKIWAIISNRDFYYSDVVMTKSDFKQFKEYINQF